MSKLDHIPEIAFNDVRLSLQEVAVLLMLYQFSDNNFRCYLSYSALRKYARCSLNSLKKYLRNLEEYGYIKLAKINNKIEFIWLRLR